jgi:hypothetical protein
VDSVEIPPTPLETLNDGNVGCGGPWLVVFHVPCSIFRGRFQSDSSRVTVITPIADLTVEIRAPGLGARGVDVPFQFSRGRLKCDVCRRLGLTIVIPRRALVEFRLTVTTRSGRPSDPVVSPRTDPVTTYRLSNDGNPVHETNPERVSEDPSLPLRAGNDGTVDPQRRHL